MGVGKLVGHIDPSRIIGVNGQPGGHAGRAKASVRGIVPLHRRAALVAAAGSGFCQRFLWRRAKPHHRLVGIQAHVVAEGGDVAGQPVAHANFFAVVEKGGTPQGEH